MTSAGKFIRTLILSGLALSTLAFAKTGKSTTIVTYPSGFAVSQPVSELPIDVPLFTGQEEHEPGRRPARANQASGPYQAEDPVLQKQVLPAVSATPGIEFDGIVSPGYVPSDSNLAVGPNDIVEVVNVQFEIFNKSGASIAGPTNIKTLFAPLGGVCIETDGDPVVLYDRPADRWVISYIGTNVNGSIASECIAVSKTNDPTGTYSLYGYSFGSDLNDYPKLSTWATATNSAYLASYNIFLLSNGSFQHAELCGFDRTKMLAGTAGAAQLCQATTSDEFGYLPSDMDGPTPPVDGTPGLFIDWQNNNPGQLYLRSLALNFAAGTSTLSAPTAISVANDSYTCNGTGGQCVPQEGTSQTLDTLGDRMMYRFAIRHFADHDRAVVNHAVANGSQVAVRWYELYDPAGNVTLNQQGTFAPDATYRWMASLAEDQNANIGMGYSTSSSTTFPGIRFTGRVPSDPAGTMETEADVLTGTGSQTGSGAARWGDYTAMQVDPSDDCTFWYVDQYQAVTGSFDWHTAIASFAFNGCGGGGGGAAVTLAPASLPFGSVVEGVTSAGKTVTVTNSGTTTLNIGSIVASGDFALVTSTKPCGATLAAGANCKIKVTFTPTQLGALTGDITFTDNATNSPQLLPLTGTGVAQATLTPATATYAATKVGTTSAAKVFTLANKQSAALTGIAITTTGDFAVSTTTCTASLAAKASCKISVTFTPTATGTRTGTLHVSDSAGSSPQISNLTGTGK